MRDYQICSQKRQNANAHLEIQMSTTSVAAESHFRGRVILTDVEDIKFQGRRYGDSYFLSALSLDFNIQVLWGIIIALMAIAMRPQRMGCTFRAIFPSSAGLPTSLFK